VRELRNTLERAMILAGGDRLGLEHLWLEVDDDEPAPRATAASDDATGSLADLERRTIERTLAEVSGNRRAAAAKLGIGLRTLYDKLKKYQLR
jgi:DNA-binding NtrC family response regulator